MNSRLSEHCVGDAARIFPLARADGRFARVNPINAGSTAEVASVLAAGATVIMLPYFHTSAEVETFVRLVDGRAITVGLVETLAALGLIESLVRPGLLDEIHFGFTDLGLEMGKNHLGVLADERFRAAARTVRQLCIPFGVAGFARPGDRELPFDPAGFIAEIAALGASRALISRSFFRAQVKPDELSEDIARLRAFLDRLN